MEKHVALRVREGAAGVKWIRWMQGNKDLSGCAAFATNNGLRVSWI